jgi:hypothetical protein
MANLDEIYAERLNLLANPPAAAPIGTETETDIDDDIVTSVMESQPTNPLPSEVTDMIEGANFDAAYTHEKNLNVNLGEDDTPHQVTETDLVKNKMWIEASRRLMPLFDGPSTGKEPTDEEAAQWGLEMMGWFSYNIPSMAMNVHRIQSGDNAQKMALYYMMNLYDEKEIDWNGTKRFFKGILTDPSTYLGLGTLGLGTVAGASVRQASKASVKAALKASLGATIANAAEGGVYTSIDDALRQTVEITAGAKDEFDVGRNVVAGTVGAVAGGGLTAGATAAVPLVKKSKGFVQRLFGN